MEKSFPTHQKNSKRLGFHYYQDTVHYTERDIQTWLPLLMDLGVNWLILRSETCRAIPETFLTSLTRAGINPVIQFQLALGQPPKVELVGQLVEAYTQWGAKYIQFYDRPNQRDCWPVSGWAQEDLVERFLDRFLPFADLTVKAGGAPVMPALEPGGSFWDTAFLRSALEAIDRRKQSEVLDKLVLSAYGWTFGHPIDWGSGGPERWPDVRPYLTPPQSQDQRGFCVFDWYRAISEAAVQKVFPLLVLQAGLPQHASSLSPEISKDECFNDTLVDIFELVNSPSPSEPEEEDPAIINLSDEILAVNFWLLGADPGAPDAPFAWFEGSSARLPAARRISASSNLGASSVGCGGLDLDFLHRAAHPIQHYLLLPDLKPEEMQGTLKVLVDFIHKNRPTIGFSLDEAVLANRVTIAGGPAAQPQPAVERLKRNGCQLDWIGNLA